MNNGTSKPLGQKSYGHIPHLPDSRMGPGDHKCSLGQARIACLQVRDKHDHIIVQEKLDGSNVSVCKVNGEIIALGRAGYRAGTSPHNQHKVFASWVGRNRNRFEELLVEKERLCGEWLWQAHGTRYKLCHEPFVAFDLMAGNSRSPYQEFMGRVHDMFVTPHVISEGPPVSIGTAMKQLGEYGYHGASEQVEGVVWRVERNRLINKQTGEKAGRAVCVDFLVKYIRPNKIDGKYLDGEPILNQLCGDTCTGHTPDVWICQNPECGDKLTADTIGRDGVGPDDGSGSTLFCTSCSSRDVRLVTLFRNDWPI